MNRPNFLSSVLFPSLIGCAFIGFTAPAAIAQNTCSEIIAALEESIDADTSQEDVIELEKQALQANKKCAGAIVQTVIRESEADSDLTQLIVDTAKAIAPEEADNIELARYIAEKDKGVRLSERGAVRSALGFISGAASPAAPINAAQAVERAQRILAGDEEVNGQLLQLFLDTFGDQLSSSTRRKLQELIDLLEELDGTQPPGGGVLPPGTLTNITAVN